MAEFPQKTGAPGWDPEEATETPGAFSLCRQSRKCMGCEEEAGRNAEQGLNQGRAGDR